jgi:hypothetical protein
MPGALQSRFWVPSAALPAYTFDPAIKSTSMTLSGTGNVTATANATDSSTGFAAALTPVLSGVVQIKYFTFNNTSSETRLVGIYSGSANINDFIGIDTNGASWYSQTGDIIYNAAIVPGFNIGAWGPGDTVTVEYDIPGLQVRAKLNAGTFCAWLSLAGIPAGPYRAAASAFNTGTAHTILP